jgi:hypothetical protein
VSRRTLKLNTRRADFLPPEGSNRRPLTAVIVGGKPQYGNIRKLPDRLWKEFGIAVVAHEVGPRQRDLLKPAYDVAVGLVDQASHGLLEWGRASAEKAVFVPSSWSSLSMALIAVGIEPFDGRKFVPPAEDKPVPVSEMKGTAPRPIPRATPEHQEPEPDMAASENTSPESISDHVKELILLLKTAMLEENFQRIDLQLDGDDLSVEFRRVVVQEGIETF